MKTAIPPPKTPRQLPPLVSVKAVEAWSSPIRETLRLIGSTRAVDTVRITTEVTRKVEWIGFEDEQIVEAGDVLIRLDSRRAEANLRSAAARLERLRLSESRIAAAFEGGAANQSELDDIRTSVREAEADADRAQIVLDDHEIRTPFTGRVTRRFVSLGSLVDPGTTVTVLNSADPIEVVFAVPEARLPDLAVGQRVSAVFDGFTGSVFSGELVTIGAEVDPSSRSAEVYARIPNSDARLRPGMFATVTVVVGTRADAVLVPESAPVDGRDPNRGLHHRRRRGQTPARPHHRPTLRHRRDLRGDSGRPDRCHRWIAASSRRNRSHGHSRRRSGGSRGCARSPTR